MFILFGFRTRAAVLATLTLACRNGHIAAHRVIRRTRWFTLFFIPVIPFNRKYLSVCIQCGLTFKLTKADAEEMAARAMPPPTADPIAPPLGSAAPPIDWPAPAPPVTEPPFPPPGDYQ